MKDFWDSLRQQLNDRLSSPIFGSFIVSWVIWNHRYLFILFSNEPIAARLTLARSLVYPDTYDIWIRGVALPVSSCLGYVLFYPWLSQWLLIWWDIRQKAIAEKRNHALGNQLLTREESRKIIRDALEQRKQLEGTIERQERELDALRSNRDVSGVKEIDVLNERNHHLNAELNRLRSTLSPEDALGQLDAKAKEQARLVLRIMANTVARRLSAEMLAEAMGTTVLKAEVAVGYLTKAGLAELVPNISSTMWRLSDRGKEYIVREGLDNDPKVLKP